MFNHAPTSTSNSISENPESTVMKVYRLAKERKKDELEQMVEEGICLGVFERFYNAVMLLARDGDQKSVNFLLDKFMASPHHAIQGYAWGGHHHLVDAELKRGVPHVFAIQGYANAGNTEMIATIDNRYKSTSHLYKIERDLNYEILGYAQTGLFDNATHPVTSRNNSEKMLAQGAAMGGFHKKVTALITEPHGEKKLIPYAILGYAQAGNFAAAKRLVRDGDDATKVADGYARGGHVSEAESYQFVERRGYETNILYFTGTVLYGYAHSGHIARINQIFPGTGQHVETIFAGYRDGLHWRPSNLLHLIALNDHSVINGTLTDKAYGWSSGWSSDLSENFKKVASNESDAKEKAGRLRRIMDEYHCSFWQAKGLTICATKILLIQGIQLIQENRWPTALFFHIVQLITESSDCEEDIQMLQSVNDKLLADTSRNNWQQVNLGLFSVQVCRQKNQEIEERYDNRLRYDKPNPEMLRTFLGHIKKPK